MAPRWISPTRWRTSTSTSTSRRSRRPPGRGPVARRACSALVRRARRPAARLPGRSTSPAPTARARPPRWSPRCWSAHGLTRRHLHQPAPRADQRAHRRATASRSPTTTLGRADRRRRRRSSRCRASRRRYFELLTAAALPLVRRRRRRRGGGRGRPARPVGRHQRGRRRGRRRHQRRPRPHRRAPGDWRPRIAAEKAGIIKPGSHARARRDRPRPARRSSSPSGRATVCDRGVDFDVRRQRAGRRRPAARRCARPARRYDEVFLPLHGAHQGDNAAVALAAVEAFFGRPLDARGRRARRSPTVRDAGPVRGRRPRAAGHPRRRPQPRRRRRVAAESSTRTSCRRASGILVDRHAARPRPGGDARGARRATELDRGHRCTAPSPRAHPGRRAGRASRELGSTPTSCPMRRPAVGARAVDAPRSTRRLRRGDRVALRRRSRPGHVVGAARRRLVASTGGAPSYASPPMDRTFVICKPDAVERGLVGEIVARFERKGLQHRRRSSCAPSTRPPPAAHYDEHARQGLLRRARRRSSPAVPVVADGGRGPARTPGRSSAR